ncbi:MAG: hypothetical protein LBB94_03930 [Clostridiales bacterium]|jgi:hypothetical protein|nr:hypothetical protein [Clostridiales bacterium]
MTNCPKCGTPYKSYSGYCGKCGTKAVDFRFCTNPDCNVYGYPCGDDEIYCLVCGEPTGTEYMKFKRDIPKWVWGAAAIVVFVLASADKTPEERQPVEAQPDIEFEIHFDIRDFIKIGPYRP